MDCSQGYKSAELKGGDQNLAPFFMGIRRKALPQPTLIFSELTFRFFLGDADYPFSQMSVLEMQSCPFFANSLKVSVLNLMRSIENIEDLISSSLREILKRSLTLDIKDQIAIHQEFKEWIYVETKEKDIWVIDRPIK